MHGASASRDSPGGPLRLNQSSANRSLGQGCSRVIKKDFPCSPCLKKVCPETPTCMEAITVDEVWATLVAMREQNVILICFHDTLL